MTLSSHARAVRLWATGVSVAYSVILYMFGVDVGEDLRRLIAYLPSLAVVVAVVINFGLLNN